MPETTLVDKTALEQSAFEKWVHKFGITTAIFEVLLFMGLPFLVPIHFGIKMDFGALVAACLPLVLTFGSSSLSEILAYAPILGPGCLYICFMTGNTSNMKVPAALSAMSAAHVKTGTKEGNAVALVAIAVSSAVAVTLVALSMLLIRPFSGFLQSGALAPISNNLLPAVCGAMIGTMLNNKTNWTLAGFALVFSLLLIFVVKVPSTFLILISIVGCITFARVFYKVQKKKANSVSSDS